MSEYLSPIDPMPHVVTQPPQQPPVTRYDPQGRRLCSARRRGGELCSGPAMAGQAVCRMHGGGSPQAKAAARLRLADLVDPAIRTLQEMLSADSEAVRLKAAAEILNRTGNGPGPDVVARISTLDIEETQERLLMLRREVDIRLHSALEQSHDLEELGGGDLDGDDV